MNTNVDIARITNTAEEYFRRGEFFCSEAVVKTIRDEFAPELPDVVIAMASGFPQGIGGAGCACGAVSGGVMALGMFFGRSRPGDKKVKRIMKCAKELHEIFVKRHGSPCCRELVKKELRGFIGRKSRCIGITGEVAGETAKIILRELKIKPV